MKDHPYYFAPEGWPFIAGALALTIGLFWFFSWPGAVLPALFTAFCLYFFRDPKRIAPPSPEPDLQVVSPADGTICGIVEVNEARILKRPTKRISIFMSPLNVHVNRAPVAGTILSTHYNPGKFLNAFSEKSSLDNEQNAILMKTKRGVEILFVQIAGFIARRIVCHAHPGDELTQGQRFGLIRFGSRVDVYLPPDAQVAVKMGERVQAAQTVLAHLA